jgi:hypothetical protein
LVFPLLVLLISPDIFVQPIMFDLLCLRLDEFASGPASRAQTPGGLARAGETARNRTIYKKGSNVAWHADTHSALEKRGEMITSKKGHEQSQREEGARENNGKIRTP